jgi:L-ascorbate metabolism protein UlaG (beta-lactamase superfamily)
MSAPISMRWLGAAGVEIRAESKTLLVDPFFSRPGFWRLFWGKAVPDRNLPAEKIQSADFILVTHSHYDHLMDVPEIARNTGAEVFGSRNTCEILTSVKMQGKQIHLIKVGDRLDLEDFSVQVFPAYHIKTPLDRWLNGPLHESNLPPTRLTDYRMDISFSFLVQTGSLSLLFGNHPVQAEACFIHASYPRRFYSEFLKIAQPRLIVPIHWDDFFAPLTQPVRPSLQVPSLQMRRSARINLGEFASLIDEISPGTKVLIPKIFEDYNLNDLTG